MTKGVGVGSLNGLARDALELNLRARRMGTHRYVLDGHTEYHIERKSQPVLSAVAFLATNCNMTYGVYFRRD